MVRQKEKKLRNPVSTGGKPIILYKRKISSKRGEGYPFVPFEVGKFAPRTTHHAPRTI
jgi:hypothetical protein